MVSGMTTIMVVEETFVQACETRRESVRACRVIKLSGRWKSHAFERYMDQGQLLQLQLHSLKSRELRLKDVGVIGQ